jgi:hypothetical protein
MNKRSIKNGRPAKSGRNGAVRKTTAAKARVSKASARKASARKAPSRQPIVNAEAATAVNIATVSVVQVMARAPSRTHKYRVGQTVFYTSSPISRPGASGSYEVVRLLPSDGDDYQYRIKNPGEAFERVAKESQLELEH